MFWSNVVRSIFRSLNNSKFELGTQSASQTLIAQVVNKACFPLAISFAGIDIFRRYIFSPVDFFYDRARDANFKCQQINMAAVNIRHLLNVKINIIRLLLLRRRRKRLEKYKKGFQFDVFMPRENKRANTIFW